MCGVRKDDPPQSPQAFAPWARLGCSAEIEPLERSESARPNYRPGDHWPTWPSDAQFTRPESVRPGTPSGNPGGQPLKKDCRQIERNSFSGTNRRSSQQFLKSNPAAPRHDDAEKKKDQPDIPRTRPCHDGDETTFAPSRATRLPPRSIPRAKPEPPYNE